LSEIIHDFHQVQTAFTLSPTPRFADVPFVLQKRPAVTSTVSDLPLNFHPTAIRVPFVGTPEGANGATGDRPEMVGVAQPIACCGEIGRNSAGVA
jgi:hypothetical protein